MRQQAVHSLTVDLMGSILTGEEKLAECTSQKERLAIEHNVESLTEELNNLAHYPIERLLEYLGDDYQINWNQIALRKVHSIE